MSDDQTQLLQQILEVQREHLAFAKQQREELRTMQQTMLDRQKKSLRVAGFLMVFLLIALALLVLASFTTSQSEPQATVRPGAIAATERR